MKISYHSCAERTIAHEPGRGNGKRKEDGWISPRNRHTTDVPFDIKIYPPAFSQCLIFKKTRTFSIILPHIPDIDFDLTSTPRQYRRSTHVTVGRHPTQRDNLTFMGSWMRLTLLQEQWTELIPMQDKQSASSSDPSANRIFPVFRKAFRSSGKYEIAQEVCG